MKILHVISSIHPQGGGPVAGIKQLFSQYEALGITAEVVCCDDPDAAWINSDNLYPVHALGPVRRNYSYSKKLIPWLRKNASRFDAVIVEGIWQYHSFAVFRALAGSNTPYYVFTHGMLGPWFKKNHPLKHLKKWLYWPWADYRVLRNAEAVIFTCDEERLLARESFWLYRAKEAVAGFGTSTPPIKNKKNIETLFDTHPELINKRIVLFVGRMHPIKGCDILLESFAKFSKSNKELHLILVGPDHNNHISTLKDKINNLGIEKSITWTGMLEGDMKWAAFHAAEIFCLPSHHENFGVVVAEALACGKPVLISNKVNIWREIESDSAGFVDNDTIEGTTNNLRRWLDMSHEDYERMSDLAAQCFTKRFHIRSAAQSLLKIIQKK
ncbi:glycosyltransferase [Pseudomonas helleri]|uniref:glycosyltransferase n=1 Tax=Pseudomonas helleri TaxID=1608996 RepID=UPI0028EA30BF|nr:glycosyltransferase [Pseudomonas helleri]